MKLNQSTNRSRRQGERGSILVICVVLAGLGTLGAAAFFSLMDAKMMESEQANVANERRAKHANSLALGKEVILRKYVDATTGPASAETHTLPGGWGEVTINPFSEAPLSTTTSTRQHKTGAVPHVAYATDVSVEVSDGDVALPWQFQIKSANPLMTGDLLVLHEPTINEADRIKTDKIRVKGRSFIWIGGAADEIKLTTERAFVVDPDAPNKLELEDFAGDPLMPDNFPFMNNTTGRVEGEAMPTYDGRVSIVDNADISVPTYTDLIISRGTPRVLDGLVESPKYTTDPIVLNIPDGSNVSADDDDDDGYYFGGTRGEVDDDDGAGGSGTYSGDVFAVIRQALDAYVRTHAAAYKALEIVDKQKYSYQDLAPPIAPFSDFDNWHTNEKEFDGKDGVAAVMSDLTGAASQVTSDLTSAMSTLAGPDPTVGGWWPPALPPSNDPYFTWNNPYPDGAWGNAPAGTSGDGQAQVNIAEVDYDVRLANNVEVLTLRGQPDETAADAAALRDPILIVQTNAFDTELKLEDIIFEGINKRPIILAMKQEYDPAKIQQAKDEGKGRGNSLDGKGGKDVTHKEIELKFDKDLTPNFPSWRIFMELENTPIKFKSLGEVGGSATVVGGIRTDASLEGDGDGLTIERDSNLNAVIEFLGRRYAWLETFKN